MCIRDSLKCIARHVRYAHNGRENSLKAYMWYQGQTYESRMFTLQIRDRVGGGDAFASGLIYAMMKDYEPADMVNFAVASSAIKHTIQMCIRDRNGGEPCECKPARRNDPDRHYR